MRPSLLISSVAGFTALSAIVITSVTLGLFIAFRDSTDERMIDDMENIGTLGVGVYDMKLGNTFQMRNIAPGTGATITLDGNQNIVIGLNGSGPGPGSFDVITGVGLQGGQTVSFGDTLTLSLNPAQSFAMLAVSGSTLLGTTTSCTQPLLPSCYDISNQGCTTPLLSSCIPNDLTLHNLMVYNLTLVNATTLNVPIGNQTALYVDELFVNNEQLSGSLRCTNAGAVDNSCLNLGGYSCPIGVPLAESCIPASMVFYNLSVTNNLDLNQVQCLGGLLPSSCVVPPPTMNNVGTAGVGVYSNTTSNTFNMRNIAPGTYTTTTLDGNNNIVVDVNPSTVTLTAVRSGYGFYATSFEPASINNAFVVANGAIYFQQIILQTTTTVSTITYFPTVNATAAVNVYLGLYSVGGTRLGVTADLSLNFGFVQTATIINGPLILPRGLYYVAVLNGSPVTTLSQFNPWGIATNNNLNFIYNILPAIPLGQLGSFQCTTRFAMVTASMATTVLTVSVVLLGPPIQVGDTVMCAVANTTIVSFGTGTGGIGTYNLNQAVTAGSATFWIIDYIHTSLPTTLTGIQMYNVGPRVGGSPNIVVNLLVGLG